MDSVEYEMGNEKILKRINNQFRCLDDKPLLVCIYIM